MSGSVSKNSCLNQAPRKGAWATPPDAVVNNAGGKFACSIDDEALLSVRQRAGKLIWKAGEKAYGDFPIDRLKLYQNLIGGALTSDNICKTLVEPSFTEADHNAVRRRYMSDRLNEKSAAKLGLVATLTPITVKCQDAYDWKGSPYFADADSCDDVAEEFGTQGIATALYSTGLSSDVAASFLSNPSTSPFYTRYANSGPVPCASDPVGGAFYHTIHVWGTISAEFAMLTYAGPGWSAWTLIDECTTHDGKSHSPVDLMFDVGIRVFVPMDVEIDGKMTKKTLVVSQVAAASEGVLAKLVPARVPLERVYGGEYAKKVLLEAKARGWKIEK